MVFGTAVRLLGDPSEAEDASQTVFLKAYERFESVGRSPAAAGWLKTVTRNACLNHLSRHRKRWRLFSELRRGDLDDAGSDLPREAAPTPPGSGGVLAPERELILEQALRSLPEHQRVPLVLFHFEGESYKEIATILGVSVAKVRTDIHRGREALRIHLVRGEDA